MLTFGSFQGINNVLPSERLKSSELAVAVNVDIGMSGELRRRGGYSLVSELCHKNLWQARDFLLATTDGALVSIRDGQRTELHPALGSDRVWYCNLPDGRTTFSNGHINGVTDGATATGWGVPLPASEGEATPVAGGLFPGTYRWQLTHVRLADGLESGAVGGNTLVELPDGGILLTGLPQRTGYATRIYLSGRDDDNFWLAGATSTGSFSYLWANDKLAQPLRTNQLLPMLPGTVSAFWRGRVLVASGPLLLASRANQWELHDPRRDFRQFSGDVTLIQPVDDGVYVGTTQELAFLAGTEFDKLAYTRVVDAPTVLGSGVAVRGERIKRGDGVGQGTAMVCIADSTLVAGFGGGVIQRLAEARYQTSVQEVSATFREVGGIPQYLAVPQ